MELKERLKRTHNQLDYSIDKIENTSEEAIEAAISEVDLTLRKKIRFLQEGIEGNQEIRPNLSDADREYMIEHREECEETAEELLEAVELLQAIRELSDETRKVNIEKRKEQLENTSHEQEKPTPDSYAMRRLEEYRERKENEE